MTGYLYDEVVPSTLELIDVDEKRERFIPRSSKYLLYAYHLLQNADDNRCSHVSIDKWVKFWFKKTSKYHPLPPRKEKKTVQPKSTHNPLGDIAIHERWSIAEETLFVKLYIERSLKEEVYLAAYLACWLCVFVLLSKDVNSIRPSTFKMASLMANSRRVNLAIPILASIYEGLNIVVTSPKPAGTSHSFPIRFVYACLPYYFKTHYSIWQELHSPKMTRFSGEGGAKSKSIKITLKRKKSEDKQVDGGENNLLHALVPSVVVKCDSQATLEDEVQSIDVGEESETNHSSTMTHPLGIGLKRKQSPPPVAVSIFEGESFLFNYKKEFNQRLWNGLLVKISNTPVLSSIKDDVYLILESMKSFHKFGVSKMEELLNTFFVKLRAYDEARSLSSEKLS
ncbi:UNVERIFIED_CONTAM: hypothetical protein Sradi_6814900 [Sesamum radiatum]|uniref:Aminotransferase-like plant mobile domain-containing protein n=1 Tax=Sesamum radiatum TaxID=300843 RepID=A0AAW2JU46_SESRA